LEGHAFLVAGYALGVQDEVDELDVAGFFGGAVVLQ